jgi:hypothetical protein
MKKIRLDLDADNVESFPTAAAPEIRGTVDGHLRSRVGDTWCITCGGDSCYCSQPGDTCGCTF